MDDFWTAYEEAKYRAARLPVWPACCDVLELACAQQNMALAGEILKLQGVLIMQELWKSSAPFPRPGAPFPG